MEKETKIEQNKQNKNVLSKGVEEKNKHEILQGKTKANKTKRPRKREEFEERAFWGKNRKYLKLQVTVFCSTDSNTPF